jgi:hypothetical protein
MDGEEEELEEDEVDDDESSLDVRGEEDEPLRGMV